MPSRRVGGCICLVKPDDLVNTAAAKDLAEVVRTGAFESAWERYAAAAAKFSLADSERFGSELEEYYGKKCVASP